MALYKTILLELIQSDPGLHERLKAERALLATVERFAQELKDRHGRWTDQLSPTRPGSDPTQIRSEALELALAEVTDRLRHEFSTGEPGPTPGP